jgi:hypothetical protein
VSSEKRPASLSAALILCAALVGPSCASQLHELRRRAELQTGIGAFVFRYSEEDENVLPRLKQALEAAEPAVRRWGNLREPVTIEIVPNHQLLEKAINHPGDSWLKAWARYDEVFLQSPRTWGPIGPTQGELNELIVHELTHCLMYQLSSDRRSWSSKQFPLWFREGIASFTAGQGYRWPTLRELARFLDEHPEVDLINHPEALYQSDSDIVYSAAHHAFAFLVERFGEAAVRQILLTMRAGPTFPASFEKVTGIDLATFARDFKSYVQQRSRGDQTHRDPVTTVDR